MSEPSPDVTARPGHVLLDRDGVLNQEYRGRVVRTIDDWRWERGALAGLALLAVEGCEVSIVTNQSAVARGALLDSELDALHRDLGQQLVSMGVRLLGIHACSHSSEVLCECRKPRPGLVRAAVDASKVPANRTVLIGDDLRDVEAAREAGVRPVLVRTGKGAATETQVHGVEVFDDLQAAVLDVVRERQPTVPHSTTARSVRHTFESHLGVVAAALDTIGHDLARVADQLRRVLDDGGTVFAAGNGGSAADAQHFVAELVGRFGRDRPPCRAVALGTDVVTGSAMANDFGYDAALTRQLTALSRPGDALIALSTSGESPNVCAAASAARTLGCWTVALTGSSGGTLATITDAVVRVPSRSTPRVQEVHSLCLHAIAALIDSPLEE